MPNCSHGYMWADTHSQDVLDHPAEGTPNSNLQLQIEMNGQSRLGQAVQIIPGYWLTDVIVEDENWLSFHQYVLKYGHKCDTIVFDVQRVITEVSEFIQRLVYLRKLFIFELACTQIDADQLKNNMHKYTQSVKTGAR